jgi:hypothetical protein
MILDLLAKTDQPAAPSPAPPLAALEDEVKAMKAKLARIEERVQRARSTILAMLSRDPRQVKREVAKAQWRQRELDAGIRKSRASLESAGAAVKRGVETNVRLNREREKKQKEKEDLENKIRRIRDMPAIVFKRPGDLRKTPILAECSGEGMKVSILAGRQGTRTFGSSQAFLAWALGERRPERDALFLLVKPSAAPYAGALVSQLTARGFEIGYQPFLENEHVQIQ